MVLQPRIRREAASLAVLQEDYKVAVWLLVVTVHAGFAYDGASIPRLAQPLVGGPWDPRRLPAATVHDWLYASHALPRWIADLVFLVILVLTRGLSVWRCLVDWLAVRRYGRQAWDSHGPEEQLQARRLGKIKLALFHNQQKGKIE